MTNRIKWYTAMLGKKSSVHILKSLLIDTLQAVPSADCVLVTTLQLGRTRRWGLAWTYDADAASLARQRCAYEEAVQKRSAVVRQMRRDMLQKMEQVGGAQRVTIEMHLNNVYETLLPAEKLDLPFIVSDNQFSNESNGQGAARRRCQHGLSILHKRAVSAVSNYFQSYIPAVPPLPLLPLPRLPSSSPASPPTAEKEPKKVSADLKEICATPPSMLLSSAACAASTLADTSSSSECDFDTLKGTYEVQFSSTTAEEVAASVCTVLIRTTLLKPSPESSVASVVTDISFTWNTHSDEAVTFFPVLKDMEIALGFDMRRDNRTWRRRLKREAVQL